MCRVSIRGSILCLLWIVLALLEVGCGSTVESQLDDSTPLGEGAMRLMSSAFSDGDMIPSIYTCDGENISPPLKWEGVPAGAKSLAMIMDDPDAPGRTWVHWVWFDMAPNLVSIPESGSVTLSSTGATTGSNSRQQAGYTGPCPPSGVHRYYFKLFALDARLDLPGSTTSAQLETAMKGHILASATLMGRYSR